MFFLYVWYILFKFECSCSMIRRDSSLQDRLTAVLRWCMKLVRWSRKTAWSTERTYREALAPSETWKNYFPISGRCAVQCAGCRPIREFQRAQAVRVSLWVIWNYFCVTKAEKMHAVLCWCGLNTLFGVNKKRSKDATFSARHDGGKKLDAEEKRLVYRNFMYQIHWSFI